MHLPTGFLALPAPGDATATALRRKTRLLAVRRLLTGPCSPALARALAPVREEVVGALKRAPEDVLDAVGRPEVLAGLLSWASDVRAPEDVLGDAVAALLAAIPIAGTVLWAWPVRRLVRGDRAWTFATPASAVLFTPRDVEVEVGGVRAALGSLPSAPARVPVVPGLSLALVDANPLALDEAHPDKAGNALDLGGRPPEAWTSALSEALELVGRLPTWRAELAVTLSTVAPVGYEPERHLSASYREVPGLAYLTLHPDPVTLAEAIVHETQHGKLNLLTWLDPVLDNAWTTWTASPVRPDLRPVMGVLLAVHAFVPVAALHAALAAEGHPLAATAKFAERRRQVLAGNARGLAIVDEHAKPTAMGRKVIEALRTLHTATIEAADAKALPTDVMPPG